MEVEGVAATAQGIYENTVKEVNNEQADPTHR